MRHRGYCLIPAFGLVVLLCAPGCSHFDRDYEAALTHGPYGRYDGAWEGTWESKVDGHQGALRCLISQTGETEFRGRFKATYEKILTYEYAIPMTGTGTAADPFVANFLYRRPTIVLPDPPTLKRMEQFLAEHKPDRVLAPAEAESELRALQVLGALGRPYTPPDSPFIWWRVTRE